MALDHTTRLMFKSIEEAQGGRKAIERMVRGVPVNPADPEAVRSTLELAAMAREYLFTVHHAVIVLTEGEVLDQVRMAQFVQSRNTTPPRVNSPHLEHLRPTTRVRDGIGRATSRKSASSEKAEKQGKVPYKLDGKVVHLPAYVVAILREKLGDG